MSILDEFQRYVTDLGDTPVFRDWCRKHKADCDRWNAYAQSIISGSPTAVPTMSTKFGSVLVENATLIASVITPPPTPVKTGYGAADYGQDVYGQ